MKQERLVMAVVGLCFFLSGMAGLVYQIVWTRYLALFLGHTSYAVVAVLATFMGGLALGNAWFGNRADRAAKPLALYGWLEIGITVYALLFPAYYSLCHRSFITIAHHLAPGGAALLLAKWLFSIVTIALPTFLMGATFPVLTRFVTSSLAELRGRVAALYCVNSAGAVFGCLAADFWWIPKLGLAPAVLAGAALNGVAGVMALILSKWLNETRPVNRHEAGPATSDAEHYTPLEPRLVMGAIGLSGFVAMLYEVAWTRLLALVLGASTHAYSIMLVTFISGIAAGAGIVCRWKSLRRNLDALGWAELTLAWTLFASMFLYQYLPYVFVKMAHLFARTPEAYPLYEGLQALTCFGVMFLPAICLGMTLPLASRVATESIERSGHSVGRVFAVNTIGTVLGAVVTGLWLMPKVGLAWTFSIGIAINASIGLLILTRNRLSPRWRFGPPVLAAGMACWMGVLFHSEWRVFLAHGLWRSPALPPPLKIFDAALRDEKVLFYRDGAGSTVTVRSRMESGRERITLAVNGKTDASTGDVSTQRLLGHIPMLLRPDSSEVMVVGFGSGMTGGAVARHPSVQRLDVVEISPDVPVAAREFAAYNDEFWTNPRVRIVIEDAKSFLKTTTRRYDVIISEPSNPWMAGVAGVFSREYYEDCRAVLKRNGLMAQWIHTYETTDETLEMVLRTFTSVFPFASIWQPNQGDLILVGTAAPWAPDLAAIEARFAMPPIREDLERTEIASLAVLLACQVVRPENGRFLAPENGAFHSDFHPRLEYAAQEGFFCQGMATVWRYFDENRLPRGGTLLSEFIQKHPLTDSDYRAFVRFYNEAKVPEISILRSILRRWQHEQPQITLPMEFMSQMVDQEVGAAAEALRLAPARDRLFESATNDPMPLSLYAGYVMDAYRAERSAYYVPSSDDLTTMLERLVKTNPDLAVLYQLQLSELAWDRGDDAECLRMGQIALDGGTLAPDSPRYALYRMIETLWRTGKRREAAALCQVASRRGYLGADPRLEMISRKVAAQETGQNPKP